MSENKDIVQTCMSIHEYEKMVSKAFQADVENFLTNFENLHSLKFDDFAKVWRNMMFSYVNSEQQYYTFIQHFMENAFFVIKKFIYFPKNMYTEVGALYLLYGMYFKQTVKEWVKIRITKEEYIKLQDLLERQKQQGQLEPLFVYNKLLQAGAFKYVFQRRPIAPEQRYLKNCVEFIDDTFQSINATSSVRGLKDILNEGDFLEKYTQAMSDYKNTLSELAVCNPGLGSFSSTLLDDLNSVLQLPASCNIEDNENI